MNNVSKAAEVLSRGGLIVYPTDTAYGLGVDATNPIAVDKLYELKGRSYAKPTHVVVRNWEMLAKIVIANDIARKLYEAFMPGPLTLVLPDRGVVASKLTAGSGTLGVRIPNCQFTLQLSGKFSRPYTTPSANRAGGRTPYNIPTVKEEIEMEKIDLIIDAGELPQVSPSTVVDLSQGSWSIIRPGPISEDDLRSVLAPQ